MDDDKYTITWMHMHKASAALYIVGGYLRLTGKVLDGACVLFIGTLFFCLSAREVPKDGCVLEQQNKAQALTRRLAL